MAVPRLRPVEARAGQDVGSGRAFDSARLLRVLEGLPECRRYVVAFSGGMDSTVLLHALVHVRPPVAASLVAVHVHHGLHPQADAWQAFCAGFCARHGVTLISRRVDARARRGEGPEAAARQARYRALAEVCREGDCLLTAHHRDDQAETLLLHLLRGSGPHGLAAMAPCRAWHGIWHARPLLDFGREALHDYALAHALSWVEDPSNQAPDFDRNFLRHEILPRLQGRWPGAAGGLARTARLQRAAATLLEDLARLDRDGGTDRRPDTLGVDTLRRLPRLRQANLIREWVRAQGLPPPPGRRLDEVLDRVLRARRDAMPLVRWEGAELRRYRDALYVMPPLPEHDPARVYLWDPARALVIPHLGIELRRRDLEAIGVDPTQWAPPLRVGFRRGGERCRLPGHAHQRALKVLFQDAGIPPWERDRIPLVYAREGLVAVAGLWACEAHHRPG